MPSSPMKEITCILCVPGTFPGREELEQLLPDEFELQLQRTADPRMVRAFESSRCRWSDSISKSAIAKIGTHQHVAYVICRGWTAENAARYSHWLLRAGAALLDAGGLGVKVENAGIAHGPERYRELLARADAAHLAIAKAEQETKLEHRIEFWSSLFESFVQRPIASQREIYTCGMHSLGERDVIVSADRAKRLFGEKDAHHKVAEVMDAFAVYTLAESEVAEGHTFSVDKGQPRFRVTFENSSRYAPDEGFHNPFGYARLTDLGGYA